MSAAKSKAGTTLRIQRKTFKLIKHFMYYDWQQYKKTKKRNAFTNTMVMDIKLCKSQLFKIIQSGGFLANMIGKYSKDTLMKFVFFWLKILSHNQQLGPHHPLKEKFVEVVQEQKM